MAAGDQSVGGYLKGLLGKLDKGSAASEPTSGNLPENSTLGGGQIVPAAGHSPLSTEQSLPADFQNEFRLAQAQTGTSPNEEDGKVTRYQVDPATNKVNLPAGTSLSSVQIDGNNIVLNQPDGSRIIIENAISSDGGITKVPTLVIGGAEIPSDSLITALGLDTSRSVAAGAQASDVGSGGDNSVPVPGIGPTFDLTSLLPPTGLVFPERTLEELFPPVPESKPPTIVPVHDGPETDPLQTLVDERALDTVQDAAPPPADILAGNVEGTQPADRTETDDGQFLVTAGSSNVVTVEFGGTSSIEVRDAAGNLINVFWSINGSGQLEGRVGGPAEPIAIIIDLEGPATPGDGTSIPAGTSQLIDFIVTLTDAFPHSEIGDVGFADQVTISGIEVVVTDSSALTASAEAVVLVNDDGPKVDVTADGDEPDTVYLFDGNLIDGNFEGNNGTGLPTGDIASNGDPTQVTVDFSGNFTMPFMAGADGGSASSTFSLGLAGGVVGTQVQFDDGGGDAGVTSGGIVVVWSEVSAGEIYAGILDSGPNAGDEVFRISVDAAGNVTFEQKLVLDHTRADTSPDYTTDILTLSDGQLSLTKETTVTDGDGDTATDSASVDLGGNFAIGDDGPKVTVTADGDEPDTVYLFDGNLIDGNFEGDNGTGLPTGDIACNGDPTQVTVDFSGNFTMPFMAGADGGSASSTFSLGLAGGVVGTQVQFDDGGGDAGVTSGGIVVVWSEVSAGEIYAGILDSGPNAGDEVFRISVDAAGNVTFEQKLVLDHTRADTSPDYTTDILTLSDGQLSLTKETTVTDGDGDTATDSASVDLGGNFAIGDDGPKVTVTADGDEPDTVYLFDGNLIDGNFEGDNGTGLPTGDIASNGDPTQVTVDFSGNFTMPFMAGADGGSASSTFSLGLAGGVVGTQVQFDDGGGDAGVTSGGIVVVWSEVSAGEIYAGILDSGPNAGDEVFRISVDAAGNVTFEQSLVLDHTRLDTSPDYTTDILTLSDGQLSLTKETTVTDGDGDTATDSAST